MSKARDLLLSDPLLRHCWEAHEAFRRLGFDSADIFVVLGENVAVMLRDQDKEFTVDLGVHVNGSEWFGNHWTLVAEGINDGDVSDSILEQIWAASPFRNQPMGFLMALKGKGFDLPDDEDEPGRLLN